MFFKQRDVEKIYYVISSWNRFPRKNLENNVSIVIYINKFKKSFDVYETTSEYRIILKSCDFHGMLNINTNKWNTPECQIMETSKKL